MRRSPLADAVYRLFAAAVEQHPAGSALFNVSSHEFAEHKALLYVYLDRKMCRSTQGSSTKKQGVTKLWEHGRFYKVTANSRGRYVVTTAHALAHYTVTN